MPNSKEYMRAYYLANKEKAYEKRRAHQKANPAMYNNPELVKARYRRNLAKKFGVTVERIDALRSTEFCDICKVPFVEKQGQHIDHCHVSNKIRGVLCNNCNHMIGQAQDDPVILRNAALYLEKEPENA